MKTLITRLHTSRAVVAMALVQSTLFTLSGLSREALAEESTEQEPRSFAVAAFSASDPSLTLSDSSNCAAAIKSLSQYEQYRIIASNAIQGPPGVVFTLQGPRGEVVLLKCAHGHEPGGCSGESGE